MKLLNDYHPIGSTLDSKFSLASDCNLNPKILTTGLYNLHSIQWPTNRQLLKRINIKNSFRFWLPTSISPPSLSFIIILFCVFLFAYKCEVVDYNGTHKFEALMLAQKFTPQQNAFIQNGYNERNVCYDCV